ncbi:MAG TPA: hypothetical protein GX534_07065 [Thermoanaerobacterales bacterium]|nr:hypothetical protein [Thermoanaerobacterales bacterium]
MVLSRQHKQRFSRHIIIPEIGVSGQQKLLGSRVLILAQSPRVCSSLMFYLVASGISQIDYYFDDRENEKKLFENLIDLNTDVKLNEFQIKTKTSSIRNYTAIIVFGDIKFCSNHFKNLVSQNSNIMASTILSIQCPWTGIIKTFRSNKRVSSDDIPLNNPVFNIMHNKYIDTSFEKQGLELSSCLSGALTAIEVIKLCLSIGSILEDPLFFDLLCMRFNNDTPAYIDKPEEIEGVSSKVVATKNPSNAKILIVGAGGLGSPVAFALASSGIGTIGIVDYDDVELTNLNRQILHSTSRIGMQKVDSAKIFLESFFSNLKVIPYNLHIDKKNAVDIMKNYDIIIGAVDNLQTRYLLNEICLRLKKPLIEAGITKFDGLEMTIIPGKTYCYRCVFPEMPSKGDSPFSGGILGPVPGVLGFIQAAEAFKIYSDVGKPLLNRLLIFNAMQTEFNLPSLKKDPNCPVCKGFLH